MRTNTSDIKVVISTQTPLKAKELGLLLKPFDFKVVNFPTIETKKVYLNKLLKDTFSHISDYQYIIFTSQNGVESFFYFLTKVCNSLDLPDNLRFISIGEATSKTIRNYSKNMIIQSPGNTSTDLINYIIDNQILIKNDHILLPVSDLVDDKIEKVLSQIADIKRINIYKTICPTKVNKEIKEQIINDYYTFVIFTSPSSFHNFLKISKLNNSYKLKIAAIGHTTANAIKSLGFEVQVIAKVSTLEGLAESIVTFGK